jgi:hypothetical protein
MSRRSREEEVGIKRRCQDLNIYGHSEEPKHWNVLAFCKKFGAPLWPHKLVHQLSKWNGTERGPKYPRLHHLPFEMQPSQRLRNVEK